MAPHNMAPHSLAPHSLAPRPTKDTDINDVRAAIAFRGITFSKFKKSQVKLELCKCILAAKVEQACNWAAELVCAGHFSDVWDVIILVASKYIHLGSPKLPIYIAARFTVFKTILNTGYSKNELALRNHLQVRQLFTEILCVLAYSRKKHSLEAIKIEKDDEFNMTHMASRLKAPSVQYGAPFFKPEDPKELYIAVNELAYHLSRESKNVVSACYWLEWILEYGNLCTRRKEKCVAETRSHIPVLPGYQKDPVWLVWDVVLGSNPRPNAVQRKIHQALLELYCVKFTPAAKQKRRFVLYFAMALLTEAVDYSLEILTNQTQVAFMVDKVNVVYAGIKKNEVAPNTNYLFLDTAPVERSNADKTSERLKIMEGFSTR